LGRPTGLEHFLSIIIGECVSLAPHKQAPTPKLVHLEHIVAFPQHVQLSVT
jgi:hypothetical protein